MLEIDQLAVAYGAHEPPVIEQLSLALPRGRLLAILGPSGCGKSTLLNALAGFVRPSAGTLRLDGRAIEGPGAERGVVFQDDALLPWLDVLGNVALPLRLRGVSRLEREIRALAALGVVGLGTAGARKVWELSGGMRQRVGIARALAADPALLLMDEPFGALDALTRERMHEVLIAAWQATGKTIALVTHGVEEAVFLATDLVVLSGSPARIALKLELDFGRRHAQGESARAIKSLPEFIAVREQVLAAVRLEQPLLEALA